MRVDGIAEEELYQKQAMDNEKTPHLREREKVQSELERLKLWSVTEGKESCKKEVVGRC